MRNPMKTAMVALAVTWFCCDAADGLGCGADIGLLRAVPEDSTGLVLVGVDGTRVRALRDPEEMALTLAIDLPFGERHQFELGGGGSQRIDGGVMMGGSDAWTCYVAVSMLGAKTPVRLIGFGKRDGRLGVFDQIHGFEGVGFHVGHDLVFAVVNNLHRLDELEPAYGSQPCFYLETVYRLEVGGAREVGARLSNSPENVLARFESAVRQVGDREELFQGETEAAAACITAGGTYQVRVDGPDVIYDLVSNSGTQQISFHEAGPRLWSVRLLR